MCTNQKVPMCDSHGKWEDGRWVGAEIHFPEQKAPRSCSFCGGIHPEDALFLIQHGWELECTTKNYKYYMHPKGYLAEVTAFAEAIGTDKVVERTVHSPGPPVKLYTDHLNSNLIDQINAAVEVNRSSANAGKSN